MSLIPSVVLLTDICQALAGSWYSGQVHVPFKDHTVAAIKKFLQMYRTTRVAYTL